MTASSKTQSYIAEKSLGTNGKRFLQLDVVKYYKTQRQELHADRISHSEWFKSCTDLDSWHEEIAVLNPTPSMDVYPVFCTVPSTDGGLQIGLEGNSVETCALLIKPGQKRLQCRIGKKEHFEIAVSIFLFSVLHG